MKRKRPKNEERARARWELLAVGLSAAAGPEGEWWMLEKRKQGEEKLEADLDGRASPHPTTPILFCHRKLGESEICPDMAWILEHFPIRCLHPGHSMLLDVPGALPHIPQGIRKSQQEPKTPRPVGEAVAAFRI